MILQTIFWIVILYGTTQICVESVLFGKFREMFNNIYTKPIYILLTCMMCSSTWIGFIYSIYFWSPTIHVMNLHIIVRGFDTTWFLDGMFGSCCVWFIHIVEKLISIHHKKINAEIDKLHGLH